MAIVKCKIESATTDGNGNTIINLTLTDAQNSSWPKTYTIHQTDPIDLQKFKDRVIADIRKDLKISAVLDQVTPYIGQTFNLTV